MKRLIALTLGTLAAGSALAAGPFTYSTVEPPVKGFAHAINALGPDGSILGSYTKLREPRRGYIRDGKGQVTTIDHPNTVRDTTPQGWNSKGEIVGFYSGGRGTNLGFIRDPAGGFTTVTHPEGQTDTVLRGIDSAGTVVGHYQTGQRYYAFRRSAAGRFEAISPPDARHTFVGGMTDDGRVVGDFTDMAGKEHGFLSTPDGKVTVIDHPKAEIGTSLKSINAAGQIAGSYKTKDYQTFGFVREPDGSFTALSMPKATSVEPSVMGASGEVAGSFVAADRYGRAFLAKPAATARR